MTTREAGPFAKIMKRGSVALLVATFSLPSWTAPAIAQEYRERRTLMEMLFGGPNQYNDRLYAPERREQRRQAAPQRQNSSRSVTRPAAPRSTPSVVQMRTAKPAPVEKLENARRVLVVGDFLAGAMGEALVSTFETSASIAIDVRANGSSGLVRSDYYDWFANLPQFIKDTKPATIVIMMGSNDRQAMDIGGTKEKYGSEIWFKEYERRHRCADHPCQAPASAGALGRSARLPVAVADGRLRRLQSALPQPYRKARRRVRRCLDGFVDEGGKYVTTGYDVNGQQARLREADGIGMTQAGKQKLAFYVEKFVRRHLDGAEPGLGTLDGSNLPSLTSLPALGIDAQQVRTQPISLTDPDLDGGDALLGGKQAPAKFSVVETPRERLTKRGLMEDAPLGRVDDYRMPPTDETAAK